MQLFVNTTSPFARLVRLAVMEKGLSPRVRTEIVDPWADPPALLAANPTGRVPVLVTADGHAIAETQLILRHLDALAGPDLFPAREAARTLATAALALGTMEAAVALVVGRKSVPGFDADPIGAKRVRAMADGLARLDAAPPRDLVDGPDIAALATVTALDYVLFRFPGRDWCAGLPRLAAWRARQSGRASVEATLPVL
ncbi:glutathione S-transferase family protein [Roseivivax isoporae]|uniref:GST N-terminal domain-containing protein n=1 Tax=Roseivivax isoporae LMG 25204 TaxID=1449351 RepID=X7FB98_9RHOB|nr:glutathione S-transferase family protein [Roseivivax isoporae]ETX29391.1 hypothetical protein RISW2_01590 [Roseivivax isoporae LMG 25204]